MKKSLPFIIAITIVAISSLSYGQQCSVTAEKVSPVTLRIKSTEVTSITGQATIQIVVKAEQPVYFSSDI